jgi:uncharacterized protein
VPRLAITPTNLLYNVVATPGALYRYWRQGQTGGPGPGAHRRDAAGCHRRIGHPGGAAPREDVFDVVVAVVMIPLGCWLVLTGHLPRTCPLDRLG